MIDFIIASYAIGWSLLADTCRRKQQDALSLCDVIGIVGVLPPLLAGLLAMSPVFLVMWGIDKLWSRMRGAIGNKLKMPSCPIVWKATHTLDDLTKETERLGLYD